MGKTVLIQVAGRRSAQLARHPPQKVLIFKRGLDYAMPVVQGRDVDWKALQKDFGTRSFACAWLESNEPFRTSCTPRDDRAAERRAGDVGGYAVRSPRR